MFNLNRLKRYHTADYINFAILVLVSAFILFKISQSPTDGTVLQDAPSRLLIVNSVKPASEEPKENEVMTHSSSIEAGDLLIAVNSEIVDSLNHVIALIDDIAPDSLLILTIYQTRDQTRKNIKVTKASIPGRFVEQISPSVYVTQVTKPDSLLLQRGDLITSINGHSFTHTFQGDFISFLKAVIGNVSGNKMVNVIEGKRIISSLEVGDEVHYDVIRNASPVEVFVTLSEYGVSPFLFHYTVVLFIFFLGFVIDVRFPKDMYGTFIFSMAFIYFVFFIGGGDLLFLYALVILILSLSPIFNISIHLNKYIQSEIHRKYDVLRADFINLLPRQMRNRHAMRSVFVASVLTYLLYFADLILLDNGDPSNYFSLSGLRNILFEGGPIPLAILWSFIFSLDYLFQIWHNIIRYLSPQLLKRFDPVFQAASVGNFPQLFEAINLQSFKGTLGYYGLRIKRMADHYDKDKSLDAVVKIQEIILEKDENDYSLSFVLLHWSKNALPILGFIGTVLGIGLAVNGIANSIDSIAQGETIQANRENLNLAFEGIGLAFETTFLGLAGFLTIGLLDVGIRKTLAVRLGYARDIFDKVASNWATGSTVAELQGSKRFRENTRMLLERVILEHPDSSYKKIRDILFDPIVAFHSIEDNFAKERQSTISKILNTKLWNFTCIGIMNTDKADGALCVWSATEKRGVIVPFNLSEKKEYLNVMTKEHYKKLFPSRDYRFALGLTSSHKLMHLVLPQNENQSHQAVEEEIPLLNGIEAIFPVAVNRRDATLLISREDDNYEIYFLWIDSREEWGRQRMRESFSWEKWAYHTSEETLFAAGHDRDKNHHWSLQRLTSNKQSADFIPFPQGMKPEQLIPLNRNELLILDSEGKLFFWNLKYPRPQPLKNHHWQPTTVDCNFYPGADGWFAEIKNSQLRMWQLRHQSFLNLYEANDPGLCNFYPIGNIHPGSFCPTSDGRFLLAIANNQTLGTWSFPQYALDAN